MIKTLLIKGNTRFLKYKKAKVALLISKSNFEKRLQYFITFQVRVLRGLGAIQPGVNRCKLIADSDFDTLYKDCTTSRYTSARVLFFCCCLAVLWAVLADFFVSRFV